MKRKTHKGASKRFWITGSGKIRRRSSGQDHYNAREGGKTTRNKRKDADVLENARLREMLPQ
jgi:large subunit ribosomal protein L35